MRRAAIWGYPSRMRNRILFSAICAVVFATSLLADTRIDFKATEGTPDLTAMIIAQGKIRTEADQNTAVIIDPAGGVMTIIDHSKKSFAKIAKADLLAMVKQLEDMMASVPAEMRQMMAGRMGGGRGGVVAMTATGKSATVAGKTCQIYETTATGRVVAESCLAPASAIDIPAADRATLQAAADWAKEITDAMAKTPLGSMVSAVPFRAGMVPLRSTSIAANGTRNTSEFSAVSTAAVAADTFTPPAGYKEQKMEMGRGRGGVISSSAPRTQR